jgi:hypothetical protein
MIDEPVLKLRAEALHWRRVDEEIVALDLRSSQYLAVNESGTVLWPLLAEGATRERLRDELTQRFALEPAAATTDVDAFVTWLRDARLLEA